MSRRRNLNQEHFTSNLHQRKKVENVKVSEACFDFLWPSIFLLYFNEIEL